MTFFSITVTSFASHRRKSIESYKTTGCAVLLFDVVVVVAVLDKIQTIGYIDEALFRVLNKLLNREKTKKYRESAKSMLTNTGTNISVVEIWLVNLRISCGS